MFNNLIGRTATTYVSGTATGSTTARYVFDGTSMVLAFDGDGNLTDRYLSGPAVDQVLADEHFSLSGTDQLPSSAGTTLWALSDNQGTVRDVVKDDGTLEQHIAYSPFGEQVSISTTVAPTVVAFAFGYTGTYTDTVTGDQLHGVRWYDPASQRWLTQDPSGLGPDSNPYRYCGNGPTDETDPTGLDATATPSASAIPLGFEPGLNGKFEIDFSYSLQNVTSPIALVQKIVYGGAITVGDRIYLFKDSYYELVGFANKGDTEPTIKGTWANFQSIKNESFTVIPKTNGGQIIHIEGGHIGENGEPRYTGKFGNTVFTDMPVDFPVKLPKGRASDNVKDYWDDYGLTKPSCGIVYTFCDLMLYKLTPGFLLWRPNNQEEKDGVNPERSGSSTGTWAKGTNKPPGTPIMTQKRDLVVRWTNGGMTEAVYYNEEL